MDALRIENLSKSFGSLKVIDNLSITVKENMILGFIGKNGSGKTTTMKMILGFIKPDTGHITVCGEDVRYGSTHTNRHIGYLPDVPEFYGYMTPKQYLNLCGKITGLTQERIAQKTEELLPIVGLDGVYRKIKGFSRGMKQRLGIAQALFNEPRLLICDEPTSALDPAGRREILDILKGMKKRTTIVFSTHILSDVEQICDTIGILDCGRIVLEGMLSDMKGSYRDERLTIELRNTEMLSFLKSRLQEMPEVKNITMEGSVIQLTTCDAETTGRSIVKILAATEISLSKFEVMEPNLEQVFLGVVGK